MLQEQTIAKMESIRLYGMAKSFRDLMGKPQRSDLSHEEFIGLLVDAENTYRENIKLKRLLQGAKLKQQACLEDIEYSIHRGLHKKTVLELMTCKWITNHQNVLISGPTGIGKSFIACALGNCACRKGFSVYYSRAPRMFSSLLQAKGDGSYLKHLSKLSRFNVLIIDDIGLAAMNEMERKDLLEIVEDRNLVSSTVIASQLPIKDWYQIIGDHTIADAICDRLLHNAYKFELKGDSMRIKSNTAKTA